MVFMHYYEVAPDRIVRQSSAFFTYRSEESQQIGQIVRIEVGKKILIGVIIREVVRPSYNTKPIMSPVESQPLPSPLVELTLWLSDYYATHLATIIKMVLPSNIQRIRRIKAESTDAHISIRKRTNIMFTPDQNRAIDIIDKVSTGSILLHGVTGSGKTAIYIEAARRTLAANRSVIILVPEIALTSQLVDEFRAHFSEEVILTHSRQTESERHRTWQKVLSSPSANIVIGPRSALFLPLKDIGLIIIDEAHEPSFKQEKSPRYSSLRAASVLAKFHNAKLVLGSATPNITDYYLAEHFGQPIITLPKSAQKNTIKPTAHLIDMTKRDNFKKHRFLSDKLIDIMNKTFAQNNQVLIFHNRRGTTTTTLCKKCGWVATCPDTFIPLTLHADQNILCSHVTGRTWPIPTSCPECGEADIIHKGIGTKLIENELRKLFPSLAIARFDGDNKAAEAIDQRYKDLYDGKINLIIGTQVVAKGLDLPHLRTVGVIQADAGLALPDYGASERTFQLLAQVVGRVGRNHHATDVIVQSYQPTHPAVVDGLAQDYANFYQTTLAERQRANFPPFSFLLKLTCVYKTEAAAIKNARQLASQLHTKISEDIRILGPAPAFYERQYGTYRWQLILKSSKRQLLIEAIKHVPSTHWQIELDPISLL